MTLYVVPESEPEPLPYDEANAEFKAHWDQARRAYSDLLTHAGSLAVPLFARGSAGRGRVRAAQYPAERIAEHVRALTEHLAICEDIFARAEPPTTPPTTAPITTEKEHRA